MFGRKIIILSLLLAMASCGFSSHKRSLNLYYDELSAKTTSLDVIKKYGPSQQMWHQGRNNIYSYSYSKPIYDFFSFLPAPFFMSKFDNYETILTFDEKGKLADIRKFRDRVNVRSWLICEARISDCEIQRESLHRSHK